MMSYCKQCGAYIPDGDTVCPACGAGKDDAGAQAQARAEAQNPAGHKESRGNGEYHSGAYYSGYTGARPNAERYASEYDADASENRVLAFLCYLGVLLVIPYFVKPDSQFIRYHCNQGLVLFLFSILLGACSWIPVIGWAVRSLGSIFALYCLIKGLVNVSRGKRSPLPIIGEISLIK
jgi:uncharacterized membrane protein